MSVDGSFLTLNFRSVRGLEFLTFGGVFDLLLYHLLHKNDGNFEASAESEIVRSICSIKKGSDMKLRGLRVATRNLNRSDKVSCVSLQF